MSDVPTLSVVIATRDGWAPLEPVVSALVPQIRAVRGEVVITDGRGDTPSPPTEVRWFPLQDRNLLRLRATALHRARGSIVAVGEDHAVPTEGWCEAVLRAHAEQPEAAAIVGCLRNATDNTVNGRANFLAFAAPFTPPMPVLPGRPPPVSTLSFKREALEGLSDAPGAFEANLIPRVFAEGGMAVDDRIVVDHHQDHGLLWSILNSFAVTRASYGYASDRGHPGRRREVARWVARHLFARIWHEASSASRATATRVQDLAAVVPIAMAAEMGAIVGAVAGPGRAPDRLS